MSKAEVVASGLMFPEGPVVLPDGRIAVCEEFREGLRVYDGRALGDFARTGGAPNGATLGSDGCVYVAQNGGVVGDWRTEVQVDAGIQKVTLAGEVSYVVREAAGRAPVCPNDIAFGPDGRLYWTDPAHGYNPDDKQPGYIYAMAADGAGELVVEPGAVYDNGLGFTTDGKLIWVESYNETVMTIDASGNPTRFCQLPPGHVPDGFCVASDGRIFVATLFSHGVTVVSPDGKVLDHIALDDMACNTNCALDGSTLWVTDVGMGYQSDMSGGRLWRVETDAPGPHLYHGAL